MNKKKIEVFIIVDSDGDVSIGPTKDAVHEMYVDEFGDNFKDGCPPVFKLYKVTAEVELPEEEVELSALPVAVG